MSSRMHGLAMSTMSRRIYSAVLTVVGTVALASSVFAADLAVPVRPAHFVRACGPCGCLRVTYVYHRDIRTTYGTGFDPRNYDQTEPYFYPGPVRRYARYWVCLEPAW